MWDIGKAFRRPPAVRPGDRNGGFPRLSDGVAHALRHTCASRLVQRGVGLKVVQQWMGHKRIEVTLRYAHLSPTSLLEAVKVLEEDET